MATSLNSSLSPNITGNKMVIDTSKSGPGRHLKLNPIP
jgi:hypothetical protein